MVETLQSKTRVREPIIHSALAGAMGWGLFGGLLATLIMDLVLIGSLSAVGMPALTCFSIVGDTVMHFLSMFGLAVAGGIPTGVAAHYLIGPLVGVTFGTAVARTNALRANNLKGGMVLGILYVQIVSQPILATASILLKMTVPQTVQWFGISFVMHVLCGAVLGAVVSHGLQPRRAPQPMGKRER